MYMYIHKYKNNMYYNRNISMSICKWFCFINMER